jgi:ribonuclease HI
MHGLTQEHARNALDDGWSELTLKTLHRYVQQKTRPMADDYRMGIRYIAPFAFLLLGRLIYKGATERQIARTLDRMCYDCDDDLVNAYTDGSGTTKEKPAGIGVVLYWYGGSEFIAENIGNGTNNRAELCAIWRALRAVPDIHQPIKIHSDSEYAIGALTQNWQRNKNAKLIECIRRDIGLRDYVEFRHVDGHEGHEGNEVADRLAAVGRKLVTQVTEYPNE